ncbi:MAG TPA: MarR family transcriptional regulator [Xanthobacteraceae bacterium]|jgi:DNA-binding MarR family transcriptional regulator
MKASQDAVAVQDGPALPETSICSEAAPLRLEDFLPHRLNVLSNLVSQALTRVYGGHGITIPEWRVLVSLGQFGVMTGKAIGVRTHMHKTKVSRAVAELERRKWLSRRSNRSDLREAFLSLTPAGRAVYEELAPRALEFTARLSQAVSPNDQPAFDRAVKQLTERSAELVGKISDQGSEIRDPGSDIAAPDSRFRSRKSPPEP